MSKAATAKNEPANDLAALQLSEPDSNGVVIVGHATDQGFEDPKLAGLLYPHQQADKKIKGYRIGSEIKSTWKRGGKEPAFRGARGFGEEKAPKPRKVTKPGKAKAEETSVLGSVQGLIKQLKDKVAQLEREREVVENEYQAKLKAIDDAIAEVKKITG